MSFLENIIDNFQNYVINETMTVSEKINNLKRSNQIDEDDLPIHSFILSDVLKLFNKAIINKMATDLLINENYCSWACVTIYYSNFFLAQILNRLKGDFFVYIPIYGGNGRKNIRFRDGKYLLTNIENNRYKDSHKSEFLKLRENYASLYNLNIQGYGQFFYAIEDNINESEIRNEINYRLSYYREMVDNRFNTLSLNECIEAYQNNDFEKSQEFKLLKINHSRLNLVLYILHGIKNINNEFENKYNEMIRKLKNEIEEVSQDLKVFHSFSPTLKNHLRDI